MKEIGSEFWTADISEDDNNLEYLKIGKDYKLFMSGRIAIDYVLKELNDDKKIVYMPDYCCESMTNPFIENGYKIEYYKTDLINNRYEINTNFECSIFFAMSYFGYNSSNMDEYIEKFSKRSIIVIEDITHRLLCEKNHCDQSTYLVGSLRKWFPIISGGIAINLSNKFKSNTDNYEIDDKFVDLKQQAMDLKKEYINGNEMDKSVFLHMFDESNTMIEDDRNKKIDEISINILKHINIDEIKNKRIENCREIEKKLKDITNIKLLFKYNEGDCPLFVPVIIKNRNNIRKQLIDNNIYLPIHWPNTNNIKNKIYEEEISLINDQRYEKNDISEYINKFIKILGEQ